MQLRQQPAVQRQSVQELLPLNSNVSEVVCQETRLVGPTSSSHSSSSSENTNSSTDNSASPSHHTQSSAADDPPGGSEPDASDSGSDNPDWQPNPGPPPSMDIPTDALWTHRTPFGRPRSLLEAFVHGAMHQTSRTVRVGP